MAWELGSAETLRSIDKSLKRIADALEKTANPPVTTIGPARDRPLGLGKFSGGVALDDGPAPGSEGS